MRQPGDKSGEESLRGVVDFLPALAGGGVGFLLGGPGGAAIGGKAGLALAGGMGAANAFEKTDSLGHTAVAGAMPFLGGPVTESELRSVTALSVTLSAKQHSVKPQV